MLVNSNPLDFVGIFKLSRASHNKMIQNLWWAAGVLANPGIRLWEQSSCQ